MDPGPISSGSKRRQSRNDALVAWLTEQDGSLGEPRVISGTALSSFVAPLVAVATGVGVLAALATGTAVFVPSVVVMVLFAVFSVRRYSIIVSGDHVVVVKLDLLGRPSVVVTQWARGKASATLHRGTLMDRLDLPTSQPRRAYVLRTDRDHLRTIAKQSGTEAVVSTDLLRRAALVALFVVVAGAQFGLGKVVTTDTGSPNEETADDSDTGRPLDPGPAPAVETSTPETLTLRCDHEGLTRTVLERDAQSIVIVERFAGAVQPRQPQPCTLDEVAGQLVASIASIGRSVVVSYYLDTCYSGSFIFECQEEKQDWVPFALADDPDLIVGLGVSTAYIEHVVGHETSETFPVVVMPLTNEP